MMNERFAELDSLAERWGLSGLELVGKGLEFSVYRAQERDGQPVAVRLAQQSHKRTAAALGDAATKDKGPGPQEALQYSRGRRSPCRPGTGNVALPR